MEGVAAFSETCRSIGVPVVIERSRSGNGAHAWFSLAAPISPHVARRLGCYLIWAGRIQTWRALQRWPWPPDERNGSSCERAGRTTWVAFAHELTAAPLMRRVDRPS